MAKIKVLLIEDNRLLRDGAGAMLSEQKDLKVVSSAGNKSAIEKAKSLVPDVVLLDLGLKSQSSLNMVKQILKEFPKAEVVIMDLIPEHSEVIKFVKAGASGFISKDATLDSFLNTIRSVVKGVKVLPPTMADSLFSKIVESAIQGRTVDQVLKSIKFTKQELEVISFLAEGKSITTVANKLKVSVHTIKNHVRNIQDKLALQTRLDIASFAHKKPSS